MSNLLKKPAVRWGALVVLVALAVVLPLMLPEVANDTIARICVFAVAVLGLNVVMGYGGQVSLGQIFFLGLGSYVTAYGATNDWNIVLTFLAALVLPAIAGLVIALAAARLGGLAIAMVTIALPIVGLPLARRLDHWTGGSQGLSSRFSDAPEWTGLYHDQWQLYIVLVIAVVTFVLVRNFVRGKFGRALAIVKENEAVASSMGISPYWYKVLSFTIASMVGGISGFMYMSVVQYTSPETLAFHHSITLLAAMVVGGSATLAGSVIGGVYFVFVPVLTNAINPNLTAMLQGAILLLVLFLLPGGLASLPRRIAGLRRSSGSRPGAPPREEAATRAVQKAASKQPTRKADQ